MNCFFPCVFFNTLIQYTIKSASGYYIGSTANKNQLLSHKTTKDTNKITYDSNSVKIVGSGGSVLRYNANATNGTRFRYYKATSYTSQQAIQLYKLA